MKLKNIVQRFIEEERLCAATDKLLVALSGGADSVALLRVLLALGYDCECVHCNFHLRGAESDRDESFVRDLCIAHGVPLHVKHFDTEGYAQEHRVSIEMAARELRYDWFEKLRIEVCAQAIAVAHHRDDNVETLLLNLIRGTGINGLKGMLPKNGYVIRPLLVVSREDILDYLAALGQEYVTDSTNLQDEYTRNKIRLNILPLMKELNPSVVESISETQARLAEVAAIYQTQREARLKEVVEIVSEAERRVFIADVVDDVAPASLLHELLYPLGFNAGQMKDLLHCLKNEQSGRRFRSKEWEALRDREYLLLRRLGEERAVPQLEWEIREITPAFAPSKDRNIATLDADKVALPLEIRPWKSGDSFIPFGMRGRKNVCKYMTDRKFSLFRKEHQLVVCSGEDIVWLVGERTDERFRVTEKTRRVLVLRVTEG